MLSVTSGELDAWLAAFLWPFMRIIGLLIAAPLPGSQRYPARVKVALAILITLIVAPTLPAQPAAGPASVEGMLIVIQQLVIGLAMGFTVRLLFAAVDVAGDLIGMQMGLGFAYFYDARNATQMPVIAQFLGLLAALSFLALNGHLLVLAALAESFRTIPIVAALPEPGLWRSLAGFGSNVFHTALLLSLPLIAAMLIANLALGVLTRAAPQLNVFAIGFPVTLAIGFGMLLFSLPYILQVFGQLADRALRSLSVLGA